VSCALRKAREALKESNPAASIETLDGNSITYNLEILRAELVQVDACRWHVYAACA